MNNLTPKQRIEKTHVKLMGHKATLVYSSVLMVGDVTVADNVPTAYTNGRDVVYGTEFVKKLSDAELAGVILHENLHKAYQHHWLWKHLWQENARLANCAADYVINCEIMELSRHYPELVRLPEGCLYSVDFERMDTRTVYNLLKQKDQEGSGGGEGSFDEHDFSELSEGEQDAVRKEIDQALRQGQLLASKQGGTVPRGVESLTTPVINWREQLMEFMSEVSSGRDDSTWRKPHRRWLSQDMYMPSAVSVSMGTVVVGVDTSGSIDAELVSKFLSELVGVCDAAKPEVLHVLDVDSAVAQHRVFAQDELHKVANITEFKGGGGTDMRKIFSYVEDNNLRPDVVIVLTDGMTPFPDALAVRSLWAITTSRVSPVGATVHIC